MLRPPDYATAQALYAKHATALKRQRVGDLELLSYAYADWAMFRDDPVTRNFRGIVYHVPSGEVASLPFAKFFNVGEKPETTGLEIKGYGQVKHDGSMVQMSGHRGRLIVASRSSLDGYVNARASQLVTPELREFVLAHERWTFLFELEDADQPVVVPHQETRLVFLNARDKRTGEYLWDETPTGAPLPPPVERLPVPISWPMRLEPGSLERWLKEAERERIEGFVLWVKGYGPVKIKTPWYLKAHGIVTGYRPRDWVAAWAQGNLDDVAGVLGALGAINRLDRMRAFEESLNREVSARIGAALEALEIGSGDFKTIALTLRRVLGEGAVDALLFGVLMGLARSGAEVTPALVMAEFRRALADSPGKIKAIADSHGEQLRQLVNYATVIS